MRIGLRLLLAVVCLAAVHPDAVAFDGRIEILTYPDRICSIANLPAPSGSPGVLNLVVEANPFGASANGIRGVEYSIEPSVSTDWLYLEDFALANADIVLGTQAVHGTLPGGVNLAWASCQSGLSISLQTLTLVDVTGEFHGFPVQLTVSGHSNPSNPFFRCPLFNLCDDPVFTKVCVGSNVTTDYCPFPPGARACLTSTGGIFLVNGPCPCLCVQVEARTWGEVKSLYH